MAGPGRWTEPPGPTDRQDGRSGRRSRATAPAGPPCTTQRGRNDPDPPFTRVRAGPERRPGAPRARNDGTRLSRPSTPTAPAPAEGPVRKTSHGHAFPARSHRGRDPRPLLHARLLRRAAPRGADGAVSAWIHGRRRRQRDRQDDVAPATGRGARA
jgi:hypothetical protein